MKTPDTPEAMPSAMDSADFLESPEGHKVTVTLCDIYDFIERELMIYVSQFDPRWPDHIDKMKREAGELIARLMGFPCNWDQHQQPHDIIKMFPFSLSPHAYDTREEFELVVLLFWLWIVRISLWVKEHDIETVMANIRALGIGLNHHFGSDNKTIRRIAYEGMMDWVEWFRFTHGCFDLESGILTDRETPTMREVLAKWGHK